LFFEASVFSTASQGRFSINDNSADNRVEIAISSNISYLSEVNNVSQFTTSAGSVSANVFQKIAARYAVNDYNLYQNGSSIITNTSADTFSPSTLSDIDFALANTTSFPFYGRIRQIAVFDQALTDAELAAITS